MMDYLLVLLMAAKPLWIPFRKLLLMFLGV